MFELWSACQFEDGQRARVCYVGAEWSYVWVPGEKKQRRVRTADLAEPSTGQLQLRGIE